MISIMTERGLIVKTGPHGRPGRVYSPVASLNEELQASYYGAYGHRADWNHAYESDAIAVAAQLTKNPRIIRGRAEKLSLPDGALH